MQERDAQFVHAGRHREGNILEPRVDLFDGGLSYLIQRFQISAPTNLQLEELATRMGPAGGLEGRASRSPGRIELTISAIGVGLQDTGP